MLMKLGEQRIHQVRWILTLSWLLLILSLFYDPVSSWFTKPNNTISPLSLDLENCLEIQGSCLPEQPYALGAPIFWGLVVPSAIFILLVFGHEFWRRICPLSFLSQIPRALGKQRQSKKTDHKTGKVRYELVKVGKDSWLARNAIYLQSGLFFLGLCSRILFVNSNRLALGTFLIAVIICAITVGYLYGGKSWCHYFCPMAPVQKVYAEPRALLNSTAHDDNRQKITQSMCRTVSQDGKELSACVACTSPCMDTDAERSYWDNITKPDRQLLYYGYVGIAIGYFVYYFLYSGNWNYYTSGAWSHEENQLGNLFKPGFYIAGQAIAIPKLVAVPLTLAAFTLGGYFIGRFLEKRYKAYRFRKKQPLSQELVRHRMFTLSTFLIFNIFFVFAGKNYIRLLPEFLQYLFPVLIATCSSLWLYRTWQRRPDVYQREGLASRLRKQLQKLNLDTSSFLEGRSLPDLTADEVYVLAKVLPGFDKDKKLQSYRGILKDALDEGYVQPADTLASFQQMRLELNISDHEHDTVLTELGQKHPDLFDPTKRHSQENILRLASYRETLLETILDSWKDNPEKAHVAELLKVFTGSAAEDGLEDLLETLSPEDLKIVKDIRREYGISEADEEDALRRTDTDRLWQAIADNLGLMENLDSPEKILELFHEFDEDNSGYIDFGELKLCISKIDPNFTDAQIEKMLKQADTSGDNEISYQEFCEVFAGIGCKAAMELVKQNQRQSTEDREDRAEIWKSWRNFEVVRKVSESQEITSFYLQPQDRGAIADFKPGQFLTISLDIPEQSRPVIRNYSLSNYPQTGECYRLSIKKESSPRDLDVPPGIASNFMHDHIEEGSIISVKPPNGKFFLEIENSLPAVLISNGVGITPMISMAQACSLLNRDRHLWFLHGARNGDYHSFAEEVNKIAQSNPNLHIHYKYSRPQPEDAGKYHSQGYVDKQLIAESILPEIERIYGSTDAEYFLCGSPTFMDAIRKGLQELGVPDKRVFFESFGTGSKTKSAPKTEPANTETIASAEIVFAESGETLTWTKDDGTILEFAEANEVEADSSCCQGVCGTCMYALKEGEVEYTEEPGCEVEEGSVLLCICKPKTSKVVLEL